MTITFPAHDSTDWDTGFLQPLLQDHEDRIHGLELTPAAAGTGTAGQVNVDSFTGSTDTAKLQSYISYHNAQTYKPLGRLGNRQYNWAGPINGSGAPGLSLAGPDVEREYKSTTSYEGMSASIKCRVSTTSSSGYFWANASDWSAPRFKGIHFDGGGQTHDLIQAGTKVYHQRWEDFGITNYRHAFKLTVQGGSWKSFHINSLGGQAFNLSGADYTVGSLQDYHYIDNCGPGLAVCEFWGDSAKIIHLYITGRKSGTHIIHNGGSGTLYLANNLDSAGQDPGYPQLVNGAWTNPDPTWLCQGAMMQLRDGSATVLGQRMFGGMYNPAGGAGGVTYNKGLLTVTGGDHIVGYVSYETQLSRGVPFTKWYSYPAGTAHLYVTAAAKVTLGPLRLVDDSKLGTSKTATATTAPWPPSPDRLRIRTPVADKSNVIVDMSPFIAVG